MPDKQSCAELNKKRNPDVFIFIIEVAVLFSVLLFVFFQLLNFENEKENLPSEDDIGSNVTPNGDGSSSANEGDGEDGDDVDDDESSDDTLNDGLPGGDGDGNNGGNKEENKISVSINICGVELSEYVLLLDIGGMGDFDSGAIASVGDFIYQKSGYRMKTISAGEAEEFSHKFIIKYTSEAGQSGFRAYADDESLVVECSYANAFEAALFEFLSEVLFSADVGENVNIGSDFLYEKDVCYVHYSDFGAVGDGVHNDYIALYNAHAYANECNQEVRADEGAVYFIESAEYGAIPVRTSVSLDDCIISVKCGALSSPLFCIESDSDSAIYDEDEIKMLFGKVSLSRAQEGLVWLGNFIEEDSLIRVKNSAKAHYLKFNSAEGYEASDTFLLFNNGAVSEKAPISYDFEDITSIEVFDISDEPLSFAGGTFAVGCSESSCECASKRSIISVKRANVELSRLKCGYISGSMPKEPNTFIKLDASYNCKLSEIDFCYESESSLSIRICDSACIKLSNIEESGIDICDEARGALILTRNAKDIEICDSEISSVDASLGAFGMSVDRCKFGYGIKIIGGGHLDITCSEILMGNSFITLPGEYGGSFLGEISICDSVLRCGKKKATDSASEPRDTSYLIKLEFGPQELGYSLWDFGYSCHLPYSLNIDNVKSFAKSFYLFSANNPGVYRSYTDTVIYRNMHTLPISEENLAIFSNISVINETYIEESSSEK